MGMCKTYVKVYKSGDDNDEGEDYADTPPEECADLHYVWDKKACLDVLFGRSDVPLTDLAAGYYVPGSTYYMPAPPVDTHKWEGTSQAGTSRVTGGEWKRTVPDCRAPKGY